MNTNTIVKFAKKCLSSWPHATGLFLVVAVLSKSGAAAGPTLKGKIAGYDKLIFSAYADAAKPEAKRWIWREPSPAVAPQFLALTPSPPFDICVVASSTSVQIVSNPAPILVRISGGRTIPSTLAITPGTKVQFKNVDPFPHRLFSTTQPDWDARDTAIGGTRDWVAQNQGTIEIRDQLSPSLKMNIIVDPSVVQVAFPSKDGSFAFFLPEGDYTLKAFFGHQNVGKSINVTVKKNRLFEMKQPLDLSEGAQGK